MNSRFEMNPAPIVLSMPMLFSGSTSIRPTVLVEVAKDKMHRRSFRWRYRQLGFVLLRIFAVEQRDKTSRSMRESIIREFTI